MGAGGPVDVAGIGAGRIAAATEQILRGFAPESESMTPITELTLETAPKALWKEFLAAHFDGGPHDVGAHAGVVFPKANLTFGQSRSKQSLSANDNPAQTSATHAEIRTLCLPRGSAATWNNS